MNAARMPIPEPSVTRDEGNLGGAREDLIYLSCANFERRPDDRRLKTIFYTILHR